MIEMILAKKNIVIIFAQYVKMTFSKMMNLFCYAVVQIIFFIAFVLMNISIIMHYFVLYVNSKLLSRKNKKI